MAYLFIYISLGAMFLLMVTSALAYHKFSVWKTILFFISGGAFIIMRFFPELVPFVSFDVIKPYYEYTLYLMVAIYAFTFKRKIRITKNLTDYDYFELEKELDEIKTTSDLLRLRYISTIGLISEGLIFYDDDLTGLFITDQLSLLIGKGKNDLAMEEYADIVHKDDRAAYLSTIKKVSKKNPTYDMKYRIVRENVSIWIEEKGKAFEFDRKTQIISTVKPIDIKLFPDTSIHEIDSLPSEQNLIQYLTQAMKETDPFYLIMIQLTNIPDINNRFGRDVGNLMIAEYIKKMRFNFAKDVNSIFRITGIQFAIIIKDQKKYEVLHRALQSGGDLVNLTLSIGGIQQVVYPNLGIIKREPWDTYTINELTGIANKSLAEAIHNPKKNYSVFGE
ncbi:MAG TPA: diguanylate cyclase [Bacillota bacterium]|nr:diguanylate cyclase [Bacillota bacterium]HPF42071.1 diguanylate cyclase [Bacillota bacterium]HPJ85793.1 diguanylate cyclase [Bacillota bacterium]HPQ61518.1 diguanylate cyclase [Bacillota bacterium]HRX92112.1 diguanylate cyclase [Candidatus Izemoplasmatales bacterium]